MLHTLAVALGYALAAVGAFVGLIIIDRRDASRTGLLVAVVTTAGALAVAVLH